MSTYQFGILSLRFLCLLVSYRSLACLCGVGQGEVVRGPIGDGGVLLLRGPPPLHQALLAAHADDWDCRGQTDPAIQAAVKANRPIKIV